MFRTIAMSDVVGHESMGDLEVDSDVSSLVDDQVIENLQRKI